MHIVKTTKFKDSMKEHGAGLLIGWEHLLQYCVDTGAFNDLKKHTELITVKVPIMVGVFNNAETDKITFQLIKCHSCRDTYYLVRMNPGNKLIVGKIGRIAYEEEIYEKNKGS